MNSVLDCPLQFAEIEKLQSQQRYADVEKLCHQLLQKLSSEPIDLAIQLRQTLSFSWTLLHKKADGLTW